MSYPLDHQYSSLVSCAWGLRYSLTRKQRKLLTVSMCWQLCQCRTDEARRLLVGVSS